MELTVAIAAVSEFLSQFRLCPHNTKVSLDEWRESLWSQVLPDNFSHLTGKRKIVKRDVDEILLS